MWAVARSVSNALSTYEHVEAMFRLRWDKPTQDYMARRTACWRHVCMGMNRPVMAALNGDVDSGWRAAG